MILALALRLRCIPSTHNSVDTNVGHCLYIYSFSSDNNDEAIDSVVRPLPVEMGHEVTMMM